MARPKSYATEDVAALAMQQFWRHGYYATSMDDLVRATGTSRHGLYKEFGDKRGLFVAAFENYVNTVVTPAFAVVEAPGAGLAQIRQYLYTQINRAEQTGLPGPGCLVANTMVEAAPHDPQFELLVKTHLGRLTAGFFAALSNEARGLRRRPSAQLKPWAFQLTVSTQGLWSVSRAVSAGHAGWLRSCADGLVDDLQKKLVSRLQQA